MRNKSFFLTQDQFRNRTKTVTRRQCKRTPKVGERFMGCVKCQGVPKGAKIEKIHSATITDVRWEQIDAITQEDVIKEGFPTWTPEMFVLFYCKANKCSPLDLCCRQEFVHDE